MDDVLPLSIYVIAMADLPTMASHFNMLEDFLRINDSLGKARGGTNYELEKKLLTTFNCGMLYVSKEWSIPK